MKPEERAEKILKTLKGYEFFGDLNGHEADCRMIAAEIRAAVEEGVEDTLLDPNFRIFGKTKDEIIEIDRWRQVNNIPTLWVQMALEPTVKTLLRSERNAAYEDAAKIARTYVPRCDACICDETNVAGAIANDLDTRAKELGGGK